MKEVRFINIFFIWVSASDSKYLVRRSDPILSHFLFLLILQFACLNFEKLVLKTDNLGITLLLVSFLSHNILWVNNVSLSSHAHHCGANNTSVVFFICYISIVGTIHMRVFTFVNFIYVRKNIAIWDLD